MFEEAYACFSYAIDLAPTSTELLNNRGILFKAVGDYGKALEDFNRALKLDPENSILLMSRGSVFFQMGAYSQSQEDTFQALTLNPHYSEAWNNLGLSYYRQGYFKKSIDAFKKALDIKPHFTEARFHLSILLLLLGKYTEGFLLYESRLNNRSNFSMESSSSSLLLYAEQGFGDSIQMLRYLPLLARFRVSIQVPCSLFSLIRDTIQGISVYTQEEKPAQTDWQCSLMSLPFYFKTTLQTIPPPLKFASSVSFPLGRKVYPRVGLAWFGNPEYPYDRLRSLELSMLLRYLPERFEYFCLHPNVSSSESLSKGIHFFGKQLLDFSVTASLLEQMDLIVSVDTAVAHLAASMGKKVWLLVPYIPDWRWLLGRRDSPWYPSMTLYRQKIQGCWVFPLSQIEKDLGGLL